MRNRIARGLVATLAAGLVCSGAVEAAPDVGSMSRIAYLCASGAKAELCAVATDGVRARQIGVFQRSLIGPPVWSANGAALAVTTRSSAVILHPDGTVVRTLPGAAQASLSADGRRVAYLGHNSIVVESVAGGFHWSLRGGDLFDPALSPDGSRVAYVKNEDIYVARVGGSASSTARITQTSNFEEQPAWSPDGRSIACYVNPTDPVNELWVMRSDGSDRRRLVAKGGTFDPNTSYDWPIEWSPDSRTIAYTGEDAGHLELYLVDVKSGERHRLASDFTDAAAPSWSPNGRAIAFMSDHDNPTLKTGSLEIYTIGINGRGLTRLTKNTTNDLDPAWRP